MGAPSSIPGIAVIGPRRGLVQALADSGSWSAALFLAWMFRVDLDAARVDFGHLAITAIAAATMQLVAGLVSGLYRNRWRYGSFDEVSSLARTVLATTTGLSLVNLALGSPFFVPRGVVLGAGVISLTGMAGTRWAWRTLVERRRRPRGDGIRRLLVFGAGEAGAQILTSMLRDPESPYLPVALLDDDPRKRNLRIMGVRVVGGRLDLTDAAERHAADTVLVAIPSASSEILLEILDLAAAVGLDTRVLPPVGELIDGRLSVRDIRPVSVADLLGRHEVDTDVEAIAGYITGRRVMVTGAGGSIGSELCRQLHRFGPAALVMLDRDESALHAVQLSIEGRALLDDPNLVLADIRDAEELKRVFAEHRPDVVFHAAALKHLTLLERHPEEAIKTNVWGTVNVLEAATATGVGRFVNISTDKAADPISVLGRSKRIGERLTAGVAADAEGVYLSVRFGNVLGSRGSVLGAFRAQIAAGGPVTVTDPEVTRFFMTIEEAVQLVIQAGAIGGRGEALVLDMGVPMKILDVAQQLIEEAGGEIEIVYTGLRPGEKLHEQLLGTGERDERPKHHLISQVQVPPLVDGLELTKALDELVRNANHPR